MNILYILSEFPRLSETFISNEIIKLDSLGHKVNIFALSDPKESKIQKEIIKNSLLEKVDYFRKIRRIRQGLKKLSFKLYKNKHLTKKQKTKLFIFYYKKFKKENRSPIKILEKIIFHLLMILEIIEIIKDKKIKHIHCHFASSNVEIAYLINQFIKIPYTFTTHAYDIFLSPDKNIKKWTDNSKKAITISDYNKRYIVDKFKIDEDKIEVIRCGIDFNKLKPVSNYKSNPFKIVSISRLTEKKGYPYLIKACKILKDKKIKFNCEIQGYGHQKAELLKLISENNLKEYIKLGSSMQQEEVLDFIKSGSVFVLPCVRTNDNDMDGIPIVLMESMAMEIPTISTNISGIPELIKNNVNGILVPQKNPKALADAILKIKNNKKFAEKIRKKSREKIFDKFNIEKNVEKLIEVFER